MALQTNSIPGFRRSAFGFIPSRHLISFAIVAFFATMMLLLWRRESGQRVAIRKLGISPDLLTVTWANYEQYMWIERGDENTGVERIGAYILRVVRNEDMKTYTMTGRTRMNLKVLGSIVPIDLDILVYMNELFELNTFQGRLEAAGQEITAEAFTKGHQLFYDVHGPEMLVAGGGVTSKLVLPEPVLMADVIRPVVAQTDHLKVGSKWSTTASDPLFGKFNVPVSVEVVSSKEMEFEGKQIKVFEVKESASYATDEKIVTTSWYDSDGRLIKSDLGNGLTLTHSMPDEIFKKFPDLELNLTFPPIDRKKAETEAVERTDAENKALMPWLPKM